MKTIHTKSISK